MRQRDSLHIYEQREMSTSAPDRTIVRNGKYVQAGASQGQRMSIEWLRYRYWMNHEAQHSGLVFTRLYWNYHVPKHQIGPLLGHKLQDYAVVLVFKKQIP